MKRLVRKSEDINTYDEADVEIDPQDMSNGIELDKLSEADVRHDRCPICQYNDLKREDGFKICPRCNSTFKMVNGIAFLIPEKK